MRSEEIFSLSKNSGKMLPVYLITLNCPLIDRAQIIVLAKGSIRRFLFIFAPEHTLWVLMGIILLT